MSEILYFRDGGVFAPDAASAGAVPLSQWLQDAAPGAAVRIEPADPFDAIVPKLAALALIELSFPKGDDGRAYSIATLLRTRHGYRGELRAVGDVRIDQLFFMRRVGFDSAALSPEPRTAQRLASIQRALNRFSDHYQNAVDQPLPLFKRRLLGETRP